MKFHSNPRAAGVELRFRERPVRGSSLHVQENIIEDGDLRALGGERRQQPRDQQQQREADKRCTIFLELLIPTSTRCNQAQAAAPGANYAAVVPFLVPCFPPPCSVGCVPVSHSAAEPRISAAEGIKDGGQVTLSEDAFWSRSRNVTAPQMGWRAALLPRKRSRTSCAGRQVGFRLNL